MAAEPSFSLKDQLFNPEKVAWLSGRFSAAWDGFDGARFETRVAERLGALELKARIAWIAEVLEEVLPGDFPTAAGIVESALPPPLDPTLRDDDFGQFIIAPLGDYVVARGMEDHRDRALDSIEAITQRFSMEYAIRHFLNRWPDETYDRLALWAGHPHYHVRRLVSEGTRPKLPWGKGITTDPARALPLLDRLHGDSTRFVTRSVANHLNDLTKSDPAVPLDRLAAWASAGMQQDRELAWMTSHALRGLVKAGDPRALEMLGYAPDADVDCALRVETPEVRVGEALRFAVTLSAAGPLPVLVDFIIRFRRANGTLAPKVFKLKQAVLTPGKPLVLAKSHRLKGDATTFTLYPGAHELAVQVNGRIRAEAAFALV
ncbi:hypothetical protein GLS40_15955 [Pseudooceanicola sp. 216_PA32_1]|uniref:3-methyladenine DNA glycosylase AlkC n=1 Tax=Pseudooceanicola pacificus TaxID=2676438 RepID=A0A844WE37_9RHOB|nr:hypothetical protein [Pseudooceanicola pacificus]MWB79528.1 hypothetical protein [Pseudooceanicola pacificus]